MVKMQEKREGPRHFWQAVAPPQSITPLKLVDRDDAGGGPPSHCEDRDSIKIRILLADSEAIYRVGIQKTFALEDDIRVVAQIDTLAGLHDAIMLSHRSSPARREVDSLRGLTPFLSDPPCA